MRFSETYRNHLLAISAPLVRFVEKNRTEARFPKMIKSLSSGEIDDWAMKRLDQLVNKINRIYNDV